MDMYDGLFDDDIPWRLRPLTPAERVGAATASTPDLVGLLSADVVNLETHLASVTADLASYRELVQTSLDCIVDLTAQLAKARARILDQQQQIRQLLELST